MNRDTVFAVHDKQLAVHGGLSGIGNLSAVESALERAKNLEAYGNPAPDAADLAAAYIYGLASGHGFNDGDKRTAWVIGRLFLMMNKQTLVFEPLDAINFMMAVAAGTMPEPEVAHWIRQRLKP